jgi:hypothetical protein
VTLRHGPNLGELRKVIRVESGGLAYKSFVAACGACSACVRVRVYEAPTTRRRRGAARVVCVRACVCVCTPGCGCSETFETSKMRKIKSGGSHTVFVDYRVYQPFPHANTHSHHLVHVAQVRQIRGTRSVATTAP